jgi:UDP-glucose 4-epimerase
MHCVVGPDGFLGSALTRRLDAVGEAPYRFTRNERWCGARSEAAGLLRETDVVYWLAGSVNPATADSGVELIDADLAALSLFAAAARGSSIRRVVFASSGGTVYKTGDAPPYGETDPTLPVSTYGRYKLRQEQLLTELLPDDVELVVLRIGNAYGPGQPVGTGQGVIAYWLDAALNGQPLVLFGDPGTTRDFTYVDDVAAALAHFGAVPVGTRREVFNIGSGTPTRLGDLARTIMEVAGMPSLRLDVRAARPFDVPHVWLDTARAADAGWRPSTSLTTGIERTWRALHQGRAGLPEDPAAVTSS